jgi:hypothetical protein
MTCSRNLFKHLKNCYQTITNREMLQHDVQSFANLTIVFSKMKIKIKYSLFISIFHICAKFQTKKKLVMTCVFQHFQSHCHIWKNYMNFFIIRYIFINMMIFIHFKFHHVVDSCKQIHACHMVPAWHLFHPFHTLVINFTFEVQFDPSCHSWQIKSFAFGVSDLIHEHSFIHMTNCMCDKHSSTYS